jgi:translation elongation factor EF-1alpha
MNQVKPNINIIILGQVNSGRSTSIDHFISKCTTIDKNKFDVLWRKNPSKCVIFSMKTMIDYSSFNLTKIDRSIIT